MEDCLYILFAPTTRVSPSTAIESPNQSPTALSGAVTLFRSEPDRLKMYTSPPLPAVALSDALTKINSSVARSNTFLPVLKYSYDESAGVKVLLIFVTMPSSCLQESVLPTITKNGMEVELKYSWEAHVFGMFQSCSACLGVQVLTSQKKAMRKLLQNFGDPIIHTNSSKLTIDLPFRCKSQFYIDPRTNCNLNGEVHQG